MGTRSGDIDASLVAFLMNKLNITDVNEMVDILNKKSGLLGLSGVSSDMRDVEAASATNEDAKVAVEIFVDRVQKYIGQYVAVMNGVDAIFTAGIGENSKTIRARIIDGLTWFGCDIDPERNDTRSEAIISSEGAKVTVLNIPTNEEVEMRAISNVYANKNTNWRFEEKLLNPWFVYSSEWRPVRACSLSPID